MTDGEKNLEQYKKALEEEFSTAGSASKVFEQASEKAARTIVLLAETSESPSLRLKAAMYILDKTTFAPKGDADEMKAFMEGLQKP